jgi:hypothetical protein
MGCSVGKSEGFNAHSSQYELEPGYVKTQRKYLTLFIIMRC